MQFEEEYILFNLEESTAHPEFTEVVESSNSFLSETEQILEETLEEPKLKEKMTNFSSQDIFSEESVSASNEEDMEAEQIYENDDDETTSLLSLQTPEGGKMLKKRSTGKGRANGKGNSVKEKPSQEYWEQFLKVYPIRGNNRDQLVRKIIQEKQDDYKGKSKGHPTKNCLFTYMTPIKKAIRQFHKRTNSISCQKVKNILIQNYWGRKDYQYLFSLGCYEEVIQKLFDENVFEKKVLNSDANKATKIKYFEKIQWIKKAFDTKEFKNLN